jgi:hypothetical protein
MTDVIPWRARCGRGFGDGPDNHPRFTSLFEKTERKEPYHEPRNPRPDRKPKGSGVDLAALTAAAYYSETDSHGKQGRFSGEQGAIW